MIRWRLALAAAVVMVPTALNAQDTIRVRVGPPAWGTNIGLQQLYILGGPPEYDIGVVYATAVDRKNRVYVYDMKAAQIRAYDADGKFLRVIGQKGSGPGEYKYVMGQTIIGDSLLAAYDYSNSRVTIFQPDGKFVRQVLISRPLTNTTGVLVSDKADNIYFKSTAYRGDDGKTHPLPALKQQVVLMRPDGVFVDSLPLPPFGNSTQDYNPFEVSGEVQQSAAGGIVFGMGDVYRFTIRSMKGPARVVENPDWRPIPLQPEERSQHIAFGEAMIKVDQAQNTANARAAATSGVPQSLDIPKTKPAFRYLTVDRDGRTWLDIFGPATKRILPPLEKPNGIPRVEWLQDKMFDVFDPLGKYLGRVTIPRSSSFWYAQGDRIWLQSIGPEGEQRLTAYKLTGIGRVPSP